MTDKHTPDFDDEESNFFFPYKIYPLWSWTIAWLVASIASIYYLLQSGGFVWLLFLLLTIFSAANFLFFLTHKLVHLPDKVFYKLQQEWQMFARFIGDGPNFIRRTQ